MKLRITSGHQFIEKPKEQDAMSVLYHSPALLVEGDKCITTIPCGDGKTAFLAGRVVGVKEKCGAISAWGQPYTRIADIVRFSGIEKCQTELEGTFLIVAVDANGSCKICGDRFGQIDLYYQKTGNEEVFATDLSLLPVAKGGCSYDQASLAHVLTVYGWRPPKRKTLYNGVCRLGIGEIINIERGSVNFIQTTFTPVETACYGERELNEYADIFLDAVEMRGSRNGNVVYLSSGWDSTALLACLVKIYGKRKVRAVTGRMQYAERSGVINRFEIERAKAVADYFGVPLEFAEFDYRKRIPEAFEKQKSFLRSHQLASMTTLTHGILADHVARTTSGDEVIFAGEISDGVHNFGFSQFVTIFHPTQEFREYSDKMASYLFGPSFFQSFLDGKFKEDPVYGIFRQRCGDAVFDSLSDGGKPQQSMQFFWNFFLTPARIPLWSSRNVTMLTDTGRKMHQDEIGKTYLQEAAEKVTPLTLYSWYLHLYNSFHWQGSTVSTITLTARDHGLETALPFWDSRLQEFLSAMPESWGRGLDLNPTKYPLKWMLRNRVDYPMHLQVGPHSYLYDIDPTFNLGAEVVYASALAPFLKECFRKREHEKILSADVFDMNYIHGVVGRYLKGDEVRGVELNDLISLVNLQLVGWY